MRCGRRVAGGDDEPFARLDHVGCQTLGQIKKTHRVDLEVAVEQFRFDVEECAPAAADRIMDEALRVPHLGADTGDGRVHLCFIGDVADIGFGGGKFSLKG